MLELRDCTVAYDGKVVLDRVSLRIEDGERVALVGPNGSGKSTLLRALIAAGGVAYVPPDEGELPAMSCRDYVMLGRTPGLSAWRRPSAADAAAVDRALAQVGMSGFGHRRMDGVSSGERRRLALALALASEAPALLLDEPTAHVDSEGRIEFFRLLKASARTVVMVLHEAPPPDFFTRTLRLGNGGFAEVIG